MSPAEAREALARAFPNAVWRVTSISTRILGDARSGALLLVELDNGRWCAWVDGFNRQRSTSGDPVRAVRSAIANARAHLVNQIAALDAATEKS